MLDTCLGMRLTVLMAARVNGSWSLVIRSRSRSWGSNTCLGMGHMASMAAKVNGSWSLWSSGAIPAIVVRAMSLLSSRWLASKCRVTVVVRLIVVRVIIHKADAASVRVGIAVEVTFDAIHLGLHLGELGVVGVGVRQCPATRCLLLLAFLIEI